MSTRARIAFQDSSRAENEPFKSASPADSTTQSEKTLDAVMAILKSSVLVLIICVLLAQLLFPLIGSLLMDMLFAFGVLQTRALNLGAPVAPATAAPPAPPAAAQTSLREADQQQQQQRLQVGRNGSAIAMRPSLQPLVTGANGGTHFSTLPRLPLNSARPIAPSLSSSSTMPRNRSVAIAAPMRSVPADSAGTLVSQRPAATRMPEAEPFIAKSAPAPFSAQPTRAVQRSGEQPGASGSLLAQQTQRATRARTPPGGARAPKAASEDVQSIRSDYSRHSRSRMTPAASTSNSNTTPSAFLRPMSQSNSETFIDA